MVEGSLLTVNLKKSKIEHFYDLFWNNKWLNRKMEGK